MKTREEEIRNAAEIHYGGMYHKYPKDYFIKGAQWADKHPKSPWVPVCERLPNEVVKEDKESRVVLVKTTDGRWYPAEYWFDQGVWYNRLNSSSRKYLDDVTHWMEIPEI